MEHIYKKNTAELSEIEKRKTILVEQAIKSPSQNEIREQLWFYFETGLIDDPDKKTQALVSAKDVHIPALDKPRLLKNELSSNGSCGLKVEGINPFYRFGEKITAFSTSNSYWINLMRLRKRSCDQRLELLPAVIFSNF